MRAISKKITASLFGVVALITTGVPPVSAAGSDGAEVINHSYCEWSDKVGATICRDERAVINRVETPSGNTTLTFNGKYTLTIGEPHNETVEGSYQNQWVFRKGEEQVLRGSVNEVLTLDSGEECTTSWDYIYSNGVLRYENEYSVECV